jgi:membrane-associated phospholipid phosphatase
LHITWAILLWRAAKPGWKSWAMALFVLLTAISTLTTGEHYLIDLIVALPYAALWSLAIPRKPGARNLESRLQVSEL